MNISTKFIATEQQKSLKENQSAISSVVNSKELTRKSQLNTLITNNDGSPDFLAINLYWDTLRSWYVPNKMKNFNGEVIQINKLKTKGIFCDYKQLTLLYSCSKETIRRKLVKLEQIGLIQRSFKHKTNIPTKSYNQMIIFVWKNTPYFHSPYGADQNVYSQLKPQTNHEYITKKYNINYHDKTKLNQVIEGRGGIHTHEGTKELIESFNKLKDRSRTNLEKISFNSCSNKQKTALETKTRKEKNKVIFLSSSIKPKDKNKFKEEKISSKLAINTKTNTEINQKVSENVNSKEGCKINKNNNNDNNHYNNKTRFNINGFLGSGKYLHEILNHLTDEMCCIIRNKSGRDFTNRAIREIAKSVSRSKKGAKAFFYHVKGFIAYLTKILIFEKRDAVKTSSDNYYIKANQTDSEKELREKERYLTEIEYSLQVSPKWHLKKKLASVLERSKAYSLLTAYKGLKLEKEGNCKLILSKTIELTENDRAIILNQIQATHEGVGETKSINTLQIEMQGGQQPAISETSSRTLSKTSKHTIFPDTLWGRIRSSVAKTIGGDGVAIDKNWLSKLDAKINKEGKEITLKAPTQFFADWINQNYQSYIERASSVNGLNLKEITFLGKN